MSLGGGAISLVELKLADGCIGAGSSSFTLGVSSAFFFIISPSRRSTAASTPPATSTNATAIKILFLDRLHKLGV
jgi:fatty acid/phospholipid biosynthesis enzyme